MARIVLTNNHRVTQNTPTPNNSHNYYLNLLEAIAMQARTLPFAILTGLVAVAVQFSSTTASAQQTSGPVVAVVDIAKVLKAHPALKAQRDAIRAELTGYEKRIKERNDNLTAQRKKLEVYKPGTEEYIRLDTAITKQITDARVEIAMKKKDVQNREIKAAYAAYTQIQKQVQAIADQYQISLVLNYDSTAMSEDDRMSVQRGVANAVVYQRNLDLTTMVIAAVTKQP